MWELAGFAAVAAGAWFLWDSLKAREAANVELRAACREAGFLFLDDTVALDRIRLARNGDGRVAFRRVYRFEYSDTGHERRPGSVTLLAADIEEVDLRRPVPVAATLH
jgi:hypothetical protein